MFWSLKTRAISRRTAHSAGSAALDFCVFFLALLPLPVFAQQQAQFYVNALLGSGRTAGESRHWLQEIEERKVQSISAVVQQKRGGSNVSISLHFGEDEPVLDKRRVFLRANEPAAVTWRLDTMPKQRPVVLRAHGGQVQLSSVTVTYAADSSAKQAPVR